MQATVKLQREGLAYFEVLGEFEDRCNDALFGDLWKAIVGDVGALLRSM